MVVIRNGSDGMEASIASRNRQRRGADLEVPAAPLKFWAWRPQSEPRSTGTGVDLTLRARRACATSRKISATFKPRFLFSISHNGSQSVSARPCNSTFPRLRDGRSSLRGVRFGSAHHFDFRDLAVVCRGFLALGWFIPAWSAAILFQLE